MEQIDGSYNKVHEHVLEDVQRRLDENPQAMRIRRETFEHPFGTIKARTGATHFLMKRLENGATEMALHVLAYNLKRVMNIIGIKPLMAASRAQADSYPGIARDQALKTCLTSNRDVSRSRNHKITTC